MDTAFLVVSALGLFFVLNALRPIPFTVLSVPSFFGGWLVSELAPHWLVAHVIGVVLFIAAGALDGWQGWLGLACATGAAGGMVALIVQAQRVGGIVEQALCEGLGERYVDDIHRDFVERHDPSVPWRSVLLPFRWGHREVKRVANVQYGPYGRRNMLDVYHRRDKPSGAPVLFQIHGGGWVIGHKRQQAIPLMLHLAQKGWVCVSVNYRLSPRATFPDHLVDLKRALAWVREHIDEYGGDPNFVVATGGSAGGHLTALVGLTGNDPEYQPGFEDADTTVAAAVPYYGVYDFINDFGIKANEQRATAFLERMVMKSKRAENPEAWRKASPQFRVREDAPPFFILHGHHDSLVPVEEARRFVEKLRGVSKSAVVYAELPGAQHAFDIFPSLRTGHVIRGVERFLDYVYSGHLSRKVDVEVEQ